MNTAINSVLYVNEDHTTLEKQKSQWISDQWSGKKYGRSNNYGTFLKNQNSFFSTTTLINIGALKQHDNVALFSKPEAIVKDRL